MVRSGDKEFYSWDDALSYCTMITDGEDQSIKTNMESANTGIWKLSIPMKLHITSAPDRNIRHGRERSIRTRIWRVYVD